MKRILTALILTGFTAIFSGCSLGGDNAGNGNEDESSLSSRIQSQEESVTQQENESSMEEITEAISEAEDTENAISSSFSGDLFSFEISLDGQIYKIPMSYKDFTADGWVMDGDDTEELEENQYTLLQRFEKDGFKISCQIINLESEAKPLSECYIGQITVDSYYIEDTGHSFELPNGIRFGESTIDDVVSAYGEPDDIYEGDSIIVYTYEEELYSQVEITFDTQSKALTKAEIQNFNM